MNENDVKSISPYLVPGERPVQIWRHHWLWWFTKALPNGIVALLNFYAAIAFPDVSWLVFVGLVFVLIFALRTMHWQKRIVFVSNQRVGEVGGLFSKIEETDVAGIRDVQNIDVNKPGWRSFFFGFTNYTLQTGHGTIDLQAYPAGIDKVIWTVKGGNIPQSPSPPSVQPPTQGGTPTIIVH